jgi:hypothetical protein
VIMESSLTPEHLQSKVREEIKKMFKKLVEDARKNRGQLPQLANQIGVERPQLYQYAKGSMPGADVLLAAFLRWDWSIEIRNPGATPSWCKFSVTNMDKESKKLKQQPVQLSLFDALNELDDHLEVLKKSVARAEAEIEKSLKRA